MEDSKMKKHINVVGYLQIGFSVIGLMGAVAIFVALTFSRAIVGNDEVAGTVLRFLSVSLPITLCFMSTLGLVGAVGVLVYKPWARYLLIIVSVIGCLNIPIGTVKGVYSIWVLNHTETIKLFQKE